MASEKLTKTQVDNLKKPGYYGDGGNLWLQVRPNGGKSWVLRYTFDGKAKMLSLGPEEVLKLSKARKLAASAREQILEGVDPGEERKREKRERIEREKRSVTFKEAAARYIEAKKVGWKNPKHINQWQNTLATYAYPIFGDTPVGEVNRHHIFECLEPIWVEKNETASRLRGRIEAILGWATVHEFRFGDNPARWSGYFENLLASPSKVQNVEHHAALPFTKVASFLTKLREVNSLNARGLEFCILTAARTGEVLGATWSEIDMDSGVWVIPKERMKAGKEHRIPLSAAALDLLKKLPRLEGCGYIFPKTQGKKSGTKNHENAFLYVLRKVLKVEDITVHGFRSTFRDWAGETTTFPREVIEHALAHQLKDQAEAAYARGTLLAKRAKLMEAWANYCEAKPEAKNVVKLKGVA